MARTYTVTGIREATDAEIAAKARIDRIVSQQLSTVRATAQNWRNGVGFGAVAASLVSLFKGPDIAQDAAQQQLADGVWLLGIGLVVAVAAFSCALRASFGWPTLMTITSDDDLRQWESREVGTTICYLRWSMALVIAAFLVFCAAYAILIFDVPLPVHLPAWSR